MRSTFKIAASIVLIAFLAVLLQAGMELPLHQKNLILDMGDMTVELYSIGGMHTDCDINEHNIETIWERINDKTK